MFERQLAERGIGDRRVLAAMAAVPRERFLPAELADQAYADRAVAVSSPARRSRSPGSLPRSARRSPPPGSERCSRSAPGAATPQRCSRARRRGDLDRADPRAGRSRRANLARAGVERVELLVGDGSVGLPDRAPFAAIAVHAAMPAEPEPLLPQLAPGGRLVAPLAAGRLTCSPSTSAAGSTADWGLFVETIAGCRFVPLIGEAGFRTGTLRRRSPIPLRRRSGYVPQWAALFSC